MMCLYRSGILYHYSHSLHQEQGATRGRDGQQQLNISSLAQCASLESGGDPPFSYELDACCLVLIANITATKTKQQLE